MKKVYRVVGVFTKKGRIQKFIKEVVSLSENLALEKVYSLVGSNHKIKRSQIRILKLKVKNEEGRRTSKENI